MIVPIIKDIERDVVATSKTFPPKSSENYIQKKAEIISTAARKLHDQFSELETHANKFDEMMKLFAESFRGLQVVPIVTATDRETLESTLQTFSPGSFPAVFKEGERAFEQKRLAFIPLHGLSQDMNRIATRYSQALSRIACTALIEGTRNCFNSQT